MPKSRTPYAGHLEVCREMGSGFLEAWTAGQLRQLPQCGGRTKDSINLDCFRAFPSVLWLENWFPMDMQTASDTVVCLLAIPRDPGEHPGRDRRGSAWGKASSGSPAQLENTPCNSGEVQSIQEYLSPWRE